MRKALALLTLSVFFVSGCATTQEGQTSKTATGAVIGAVVGGALGAATGPKGANKGKRVLIGAAIGALVGGAIGYALEQQAKELGEDLGVEPIDNTNPEVKPKEPPISESKPVAVVKEPEKVRVVLKNSLLFDFNSYELKPSAKETLRRVASTLTAHPDTVIVIAGFTDSTGSFSYNVGLSEKRAEAVKNELVLNGVDPTRILVFGCGPKKPIAPNNTEEGRALNRRVEILVYPKGVTIPHPCE
ncbi:OmpA family protein [Phorcysia thermohydrogeniphila]|uniref:Outer membrane protein OmpA-like peptidoglycan-associated protein n=1 Tax=Phorcysia thermohydrogeniphila TaxID=936138 RepID=A0A4R1GFP0_9BACT|nr:OmpA family protein [Phorcysia thermohydrogeniphila]TCK04659.1 outer membrane protein OmpA-like peptidoglycan-associated protein [Phorcysia thermohydrogeniphila]